MSENDVRTSPRLTELLIVPMLALVCFAQCCGFGFLNYDDPVTLGLDGNARPGLSSWLRGPDSLNLWHPLTTISHALLLSVTEAPWLHHAANVLLHVTGVFLCHKLMAVLLRNSLQAGLVALLFALHPWNAEPVAWITARKDLLCTALTLAGLISWTEWDLSRRGRCLAGAFLFAVLAMLSKPAAVVFPGLAVVCSLWLRLGGQAAGRLPLAALLPLLLPAGMVSWLTVHFQAAGGHADLLAGRGLTERVLLASASLTHYLHSAFWPGRGEFFVYPPEESALAMRAAAGAAFLLTGASAAWLMRRRVPALLCGFLWLLLCWLPVSGLVPVSYYLAADRYMHLAQAGLWAALAASAAAVLPRRIWITSLAAAAAVFAVQTDARLHVWRDSYTFFSAEMARNPRSLLAPVQVGDVLLRAGRNEEALEHYQLARQADPKSSLAMINCGLARLRLGQTTAAAADFTAAIAAGGMRSPRAWIELGRIRSDEGQATAAMLVWEDGLTRFPAHPELLRALADFRAFSLNDAAGALPYYERILAVQPRDPGALRDSGLTLCALGRREDGLRRLHSYLHLNPGDECISGFAAQLGAP